jgi:hypothetical protein
MKFRPGKESHTMKACGGLEIYLHTFLISVLGAGGWLSWENLPPRYLSDSKLDGSRYRPDTVENRRITARYGNQTPSPRSSSSPYGSVVNPR